MAYGLLNGKRGIITVVDGAQAIAHLDVDVQDLGCDLYAFSGHKAYGPTGTGVLYGREDLLERMPPWQGGGEMIDTVTIAKTTYAKLPFNARTDFTFVSTMWQLPNMLVVNLDLPAKTVAELIELLRKNPAKYSYASSGNGTTLHLSGELF